jgi:hypothetical protein
MRYRVRTPDGELEYESLLHVEQAYVAGLVAPEDEVLEEGGTLWRKAASLPNLVRARRELARTRSADRSLMLTVLAAVVLGVISLVLFFKGYDLAAILLALAVVSVLMRVTVKAFRRPPLV